jgi:hypothetical protein
MNTGRLDTIPLIERQLNWSPSTSSGHSTHCVDVEPVAPIDAQAGGRMACHERAQRVEWSDGESNPDLLNAIQPSSR